MEGIKSWYMANYKGVWHDEILSNASVMEQWVMFLRRNEDKQKRNDANEFRQIMMRLEANHIKTDALQSPRHT